MSKNEYDVSGHILVPYNGASKEILLKVVNQYEYVISKNGVVIDKASRLPKKFIKSFLIDRGYDAEKKFRDVLVPRKRVGGVSIGVTKIKNENDIVEMLISIHAPDMRRMIERCDSFAAYFEKATGTKLKSEAKLWTRQEDC